MVISASDLPVLPSLASSMKVDFLFNDEGGVWILHDQPLPEILRWVDYDPETGVVTLNTAQGKTQELGLELPARAAENLKKAIKIMVMLMKDGKVADFTIVPFNITGSAA